MQVFFIKAIWRDKQNASVYVVVSETMEKAISRLLITRADMRNADFDIRRIDPEEVQVFDPKIDLGW